MQKKRVLLIFILQNYVSLIFKRLLCFFFDVCSIECRKLVYLLYNPLTNTKPIADRVEKRQQLWFFSYPTKEKNGYCIGIVTNTKAWNYTLTVHISASVYLTMLLCSQIKINSRMHFFTIIFNIKYTNTNASQDIIQIKKEGNFQNTRREQGNCRKFID